MLNIQAICTAEQSLGMISAKVWTVQVAAAMTMPAARVCGQGWRQNYYMTATIRSSWPWNSWNRWCGDTLWAIGIIAGFALPMVVYRLWWSVADSMLLRPWLHDVDILWVLSVNWYWQYHNVLTDTPEVLLISSLRHFILAQSRSGASSGAINRMRSSAISFAFFLSFICM